MKQTAKRMGLAYETANDSWIVVGPAQAVTAKIKDLRKERRRNASWEEKEDMKEQDEIAKEQNIAGKHSQVARGAKGDSESKGDWDVSGKWVIECREFQQAAEEVELDDVECTLDITFEPASEGSRMWASFAFLAYTGAFRFGKLGEVLEDESGSEDGENPEGRNQALYPDVRPSTKNRTWQYQWRGYQWESYEAENDEDQSGEITFGEPSGTTLVGTFRCSQSDLGEVQFTGRKVGASSPAIHASRDEVANDSARNVVSEWANWA